jgi:ribosomal protein S18 acetylase RimI-like enzyme
LINYQDNLDGISADMLEGFFIGWKNFPSKEKHFKLLQNSSHNIIAVDDEKNKVVGFINALSDGELSAYIPLLEVLPEFQNKGIGTGLVKRMLEKLKDLYMIDIVCDETHQKYYEKFGMKKYHSMIIRNYDRQR